MNLHHLPAKDKIYYQDESVVIYCADCREILPLFPDKSFDLVLTDPPYTNDFMKLDYSTGRKHNKGLAGIKHLYISPELSQKPNKELLEIIIKVSNNQIIFGGNYFAGSLENSSCWIVWDKETAGNFGDCELAWTSFNSAIHKYLWRWSGMLQQPNSPKEIRFHPTQKPQGLFKAILSDYSEPSDLVLDPFLGSGTTAVAAKILGRKCIGIEIEEKYCKIAAQRCAQSVMQLEIPKENIEQGDLL